MKIYMPEHNIMETEILKLNDIPLAYINTDDTKKEINIIEEPVFSDIYEDYQIMAYEEFDNPDVYLFSKNNEIIRNLNLKRLGNKYVYEPQNMVEFTPLSFSYSALIKKNMTFKNDAKYNINIAVYEESAELPFSNKLIAVFGDAPDREICPANISVNNKEMTPESLINTSFAGKDFIFVQSSDGVHIKQDGQDVIFDIAALLDMNINVWLSVKTFDEILESKDNNTYSFLFTRLYTTTQYSIQNYQYKFNTGKEHPSFPKSEYIYSSLFSDDCAALIIEKPNSGYVIVTHELFFDNLHKNVKVFYEIMMQIFLKSYYRTKQYLSWITDQPIDYIAYRNSKYNLRHDIINLNKMLINDNYKINNEYTLLEVKTSNPNVVFINMSPQNDLFFYKINIQPDPFKNDGDISFYTSKHSVIHYKQEVIKKIESGLIITTEITDIGAYIIVHPCKSTQNRIATFNDQRIRIENIKLTYFLCCDKSVPEIENTFKLIQTDAYNNESDGIKLATIKIIDKDEVNLYDIRIKGGGIPLNTEPNYEMIDIGNINGRPYRIGSTMIIKLPKKAENHKDKINNEVKKHASSGDYPVIIFNK